MSGEEDTRVGNYLGQALQRARGVAYANGCYPRAGAVRAAQFKQWSKAIEGEAEDQVGGGRRSTSKPAESPKWIDEEPAPGQQSPSRWKVPPGVADSKLGRGWSKFDPKPLGTVLLAVAQREGWSRIMSMAQIAAKWDEIVGATVAQHCQVEAFDDRVLQVRASSTAWANQLRLLLPQIEKNVARQLGAGAVKQIIIRGPAAPSWKKGPWSVSGRGPRDTYG